MVFELEPVSALEPVSRIVHGSAVHACNAASVIDVAWEP